MWGCSRERIRQIRVSLGISKFKETVIKNFGIGVDFCSKCNHGCWNRKRIKCQCDICQLSNCVSAYLFKCKLKIYNDFCDFIADRHIKFYVSDSSRYKSVFYSFVMKTYLDFYTLRKYIVQFPEIFCTSIGTDSI